VLTGSGPPWEVLTIPASASFFDTLGVPAAVGRVFTAEDERNGCTVVVTHKFWTTTLRADPSAIGRSITLDQNACTVVGVTPVEFSFYPTQTQMWVLLGPGYQPKQDQMLVGIFARLKPGITLSQAQSELRILFRTIHTEGEARDFEPVVFDLRGEFTFLAGRTLRATLILAFGAVLLVLLISCLNVANLLLAQLSERRRELAVRAALGSGRSRLIRQVLTEGLLLSIFGTILGVAIAYAALSYFRISNPIELSVGADARVNLLVLGFSIALSVATALIFGLLPALRASRVDLTEHLKAAGRGVVRGRHGFAKAVIGAEIALSFLLLIGAGLLMTSALRMGSEPLGFNFDRVVTTRVTLPAFRYMTDAQRMLAYDHLLEGLERMPGAIGVTLASKIPPEAGGNQVLEVQGRPAADREIHDVGVDAISPGFFWRVEDPSSARTRLQCSGSREFHTGGNR
jgi:putative ABC transport system permease protein